MILLQLMMLPGTAMRDIMVHNVMQPFANIFRTRGNVHSRQKTRDTTWNRDKRREWWRSLGALARSSSEPAENTDTDNRQRMFTIPVDQSHVAKSRQKRTVVGLYSYAPWLTNDVR